MPVTIPDTVLQIDGAILLFIQNNLRSPALTPFFKAVADYGVIVLGVYVALMLLWEKRRIFPIASACVISGLLGNFFKDYLKKLIMRPRPFLDVPSLVPESAQRLFLPFRAHHPGLCRGIYHLSHFAEALQHPRVSDCGAGSVLPFISGFALSHRYPGRHLCWLCGRPDYGLFV